MLNTIKINLKNKVQKSSRIIKLNKIENKKPISKTLPGKKIIIRKNIKKFIHIKFKFFKTLNKYLLLKKCSLVFL